MKISDKILNLKPRYKNGEDRIGHDLIGPCLKECKIYRRGTGTFTASALKAYVGAIDHLLKDNVKIQILCSIKIDLTLIRILQGVTSAFQREKTIRDLSDKIVLTAVGYELNTSNTEYQSKLLSYLIAKEIMEIKFAIPRELFDGDLANLIPEDLEPEDLEKRHMYHVKLGYFIFPDVENSIVAFDGSVNESDTAHHHNTERTQVFRSWVPGDLPRLKLVKEDLDEDWEEKNEFIKVYPISDNALKLIKEVASKDKPKRNDRDTNLISNPIPPVVSETPSFELPEELWPHQKKAIKCFLQKKQGILEMATGTGKTFTAIEIIRQLLIRSEIESVIVCTYGNDLLDQWFENLDNWASKQDLEVIQNLKIFRMYENNSELQSFLNAPKKSLLIVSREPSRLVRLLSNKVINWQKTLIIHDEIHGFGSPELVRNLTGLHKNILYRLGLSATPERIYDETGSNFIKNEIGDVIFKYSLEDAIKEGRLCEFDYIPIEFALQQEDRDRRRAIFARKAAADREGKSWTFERLATELSKVVKAAVIKPTKLHEFLMQNPDMLKYSIFFVLDKEQGDVICQIIDKFTHKYRTYYAGTDSEYLKLFAKGEIDALVACQRLNEGVDIKQINTIFLIASDRARLDTIQRIGRCLRINPNNTDKKATVIDLVLEASTDDEVDNSDQERKKWLLTTSENRYIGELNGN